jgi:hypothetical protein
MKAALIIPHAEHGGRIELREVDKPQPKAGEVLIRIEATAINRGEVGPRKAHRSGEPRGSGVEFAGEVVGLGDGATATLGQAVMGHCVTGANVQFLAVDQRLVMPKPAHWSWHEAAAFPNVYMTAHDAMVTNGRVSAADVLLINAASSGVGMAAAHIARTMGVRMDRQEKSAVEVAAWLRTRPEVKQVLHPALPGAPGHEIWKRDFTGACSLFGVVFRDDITRESVHAMAEALQLFGKGASWGGFESLALPTGTVTRTAGSGQFGGEMLRLHVGMEDPDDLKADLEQGLTVLNARR